MARSLCLLVLVLGSSALVLLGTGQGWRRSQPWAWGLGTGSLMLLALMMHWPVLASPLALTALPAHAWGLALALVLCCVAAVTALVRWLGR
jgi:hypothetical protein